jgi:two-component system phosphate regulon sensor histidine kinase PhoR
MHVASYQYHPFSPEEVRLYAAIAYQIGVAIEKARLYELAQQEICERKLAEKALRESEERYRHIFEHFPIGIGISSLNGEVINANEAMQAITGYSLEEFQKINLASTYERIEDRQALLEAVNRYGSVVDFPARLKRQDGTPYDALLSVSRINLGGKDFYHTICQDITERKRAAEALQKAHADLERQLVHISALADLSRAISSTLDLQEILKTAVERTAQVMPGRMATIRLLEGNHLNAGVAVGYRDSAAREHPIPIDQRLAQIIEGGRPLILPDLEADPELPLARRERMRREGVRAYLGVPLIAKGRAIGILSVYREHVHQWPPEEVELASTIANQVAIAVENARLYTAIAEAKRQLENITDSIADGLYTTDRERRIITFNAAAEAITGWRAAEVLGRFCGDVLRMEDEKGQSLCGSDERCSIYWTLQQGYPHLSWGEQRFIVTKSGARIPIAKIASPLLNEAGQVVGAVAAFWDASRETKLEQLDKFLSMVSHEILTPLTNIKTAAQSSLRRFDALDKGTHQEMLELISMQCNRLIDFAGKTLRISYLKTGHLVVERQPFAFLPLIEKAVSLYRIGTPGCRFEVWTQDSPWAIGDEVQTAVVLNVILENAVKYSPPGGTIRIDVAEGEEGVLVSIADQGRGISLEDQKLVFNEFYRGHTNIANGYGLGLYLAKMLLEAQGGKIWLESEIGQGTKVHFALPKV